MATWIEHRDINMSAWTAPGNCRAYARVEQEGRARSWQQVPAIGAGTTDWRGPTVRADIPLSPVLCSAATDGEETISGEGEA